MAETVVDPGVRKLSAPALIATPAVQILKISQDWFIFTFVFSIQVNVTRRPTESMYLFKL